MKSKKGQTVGLALLLALFIFILVLFTTITPFKETLDTARDGSSLNCRGTTNFNQTAFDNDETNTVNKLTRRPTCFITGLSMVWFVFAFLLAAFVWLGKNWSRKTRITR